MSVQLQIRRDTAANWTSNNPTLAQGEPALETDTGKLKFGDGSTAWTSLGYFAGGSGGSGGPSGFAQGLSSTWDFSTVYQNTQSVPQYLMTNVTLGATASTDVAVFELWVGSGSNPVSTGKEMSCGFFSNPPVGSITMPLFFVVPSGWYYEFIKNTTGGGSVSFGIVQGFQ